VNINLPQDVHEFVQGLVVAGQFSSEEEVITTSLRLFMSREQLRSDVAKGFKQIDEGNWIDGDAIFDELNAVVGAIEAENRGGE
jgi:putative addiction module CopG family antidote